jgi:hypothetical protein
MFEEQNLHRILDQLYRSDGVTQRIMDIVPAEMVRQGWEI